LITTEARSLHGLAIDDQAGDDGTGSDSDAGILLEVTSSVIAARPAFSQFPLSSFRRE